MRSGGSGSRGDGGENLADWIVFRLEVPTPPPGRFGPGHRGAYESVEARCAACELKGGPENPCLSPGALKAFAEAQGRLCPHVELEMSNILVSECLQYAIDERLRGHAADHFRDATSGLSRWDRMRLRKRMSGALSTGAVMAAFEKSLKSKLERNRG